MTTTWKPSDPISEVPAEVPRGQAGFLEDLRWAGSVCRRQPLLVLISVVVGAAPLLAGAGRQPERHGRVVTSHPASSGQQSLSSLAGLLFLLVIGWAGTQRLWFLRAATGRTVRLREAWRLTMRYWGRFFCLGLLFFSLSMLAGLPLIVSVARSVHRAPDGTLSVGTASGIALLLAAVAAVVLDVVFTFVTPAIVFTSHRVRNAVRIGLRLLRVTWPSAAAYIVVPPLAAVVISQYSGLRLVLAAPLVIASTMLNLLVKGATTAYYLRLIPAVPPDGALVVAPALNERWREGWVQSPTA